MILEVSCTVANAHDDGIVRFGQFGRFGWFGWFGWFGRFGRFGRFGNAIEQPGNGAVPKRSIAEYNGF